MVKPPAHNRSDVGSTPAAPTKYWLVCGGRKFYDYEYMCRVLDEIVDIYGVPDVVVHGAAEGADSLAHKWAGKRGIHREPVPADWNTYGVRRAGVRRNEEMLQRFPISLVIAFPGGNGTADMIQRSERAGLDVICV